MAHGGYAPRGEAAGSLPAGSDAFSKSVLDGIGRETKRYVGYDTAETNYADAGNVSALGYITPADKLAGLEKVIAAARRIARRPGSCR